MRSPFRLADVEVVVLLGVPLCGQGASPRPFAGGGRESHGPAKPFAWSGGGGALFAGESFVERLVGHLYPPSGGGSGVMALSGSKVQAFVKILIEVGTAIQRASGFGCCWFKGKPEEQGCMRHGKVLGRAQGFGC